MIGVLVSGTGTNLQALIDAELPVCAVASNVAGAAALERAERGGIPTAVFELADFPSREQRDAEGEDVLTDELPAPGQTGGDELSEDIRAQRGVATACD